MHNPSFSRPYGTTHMIIHASVPPTNACDSILWLIFSKINGESAIAERCSSLWKVFVDSIFVVCAPPPPALEKLAAPKLAAGGIFYSAFFLHVIFTVRTRCEGCKMIILSVVVVCV